LKNEFASKGEIGHDFSLYEKEEQNNLIIANHLLYISEPLTISHPSGSKTVDDDEPNSL
jgi:hypothetical protein